MIINIDTFKVRDIVKTKVLYSILVSLLYLFAPMGHAEMSSASYRIPTSVISGGGSTMFSADSKALNSY